MPVIKKRARKRSPRTQKVVEVVAAEDESPNGRQVVEAEHTIKYSAPVSLPSNAEEAIEEIEEIDFEEEAVKKRKKTAKDEREQLRKELEKYGAVTPNRLKLSIDKYRHSESDDSGTMAEKDFCTKYAVTKDHVFNEDYLDVARKYGPGRYWFTLRLDNRVTQQWERKISAPMSVMQPLNPADPNSPQVVVNMPDGVPQTVAVDPFDQMTKSVNFYQKMRKAFEPEVPQPIAATDPKAAAIQLMVDNPIVMQKITEGIASMAMGRKEDAVTWPEVAMETIKSGQAPQIIREAIESIVGGIRSLYPRNNQNGQAQMGPQGVQMAPHQGPGPALRGPIPTFPQGTQGPVPIQQNPGPDQTVQAGNQQAGSIPNQQALNPADALIMTLVQMMQANKPVEEAVAIIDRACVVDPELSPSVDDFIGMPIKRILSVLSDYDPKIKEIPHAKEWVTKLKEAFDEE